MKKYKQVVICCLLLMVGFLFGNYSDLIGQQVLASIDSITNLVSSSSNATDSNASDSNASNSNASDSDASSSNASDSNVEEPSDNFLVLDEFVLETNEVTAGDNVNVRIHTVGAPIVGASVTFKNNENITFTTEIAFSENDTAVISIPKEVIESNYEVSQIMFIASNSNGSTFSVYYDSEQLNFSDALSNYSGNLNIKANPSQTVNLLEFSISKTTVQLGEKIDINYTTDIPLYAMVLVFENANQESFQINVSSLEDNPYIQFPSNVSLGDYELKYAFLSIDDGTKISTSLSTFEFNTKITVTESQEDKNNDLVYNNEDISNSELADIYESADKTNIIIDATNSSIINPEVFNAIKGTNKKLIISYKDNQFVFHGMDITRIKSINVSVIQQLVKDDQSIKKLINNGIVLDFASNGVLPGKALVRIKNNATIKKELASNLVNAYYFNEKENKFSLISDKVNLTEDGYYEFTITHTSKYVLTKTKIDSKMVLVDNTAAFQKSNKSYIVIIAGILVLSAIIYLSIVFLKKKGLIKKKEETEVI